MMKIENYVWELIQRFELRNIVEIVESPDKQDILVSKDKTRLRLDDHTDPGEAVELVAMAKLGEENPLLSCMGYMQSTSARATRDAMDFNKITSPLRNAWAYEVMRTYAPDLYRREVDGLYDIFNRTDPYPEYSPDIQDFTFADLCSLVFSSYTIFRADPEKRYYMNLDLERYAGWIEPDILAQYLAYIEDHVRGPRVPECYLELVKIVGYAFDVEIVDVDGHAAYAIKSWHDDKKKRARKPGP